MHVFPANVKFNDLSPPSLWNRIEVDVSNSRFFSLSDNSAKILALTNIHRPHWGRTYVRTVQRNIYEGIFIISRKKILSLNVVACKISVRQQVLKK